MSTYSSLRTTLNTQTNAAIVAAMALDATPGATVAYFTQRTALAYLHRIITARGTVDWYRKAHGNWPYGIGYEGYEYAAFPAALTQAYQNAMDAAMALESEDERAAAMMAVATALEYYGRQLSARTMALIEEAGVR